MIVTSAERALVNYALSCALFALMSYAGRFGRGWYHVADGVVIIATDVAL